jgi:hypothetical protein
MPHDSFVYISLAFIRFGFNTPQLPAEIVIFEKNPLPQSKAAGRFFSVMVCPTY